MTATALRIENVAVTEVDDNPEYNTRTELGDLDELKSSIALHGVKNPVIVKKHSKRGGYRLISGFRRVAACKELGLEEIPVRIEPAKTNAQQMLLLNVIENVQREDLNPIDEARAYHKLIKGGMAISDVCTEVGKSRTYIERRMGLNQLTEVVQEAVQESRIGVTAAQEISRLPEDYHAKYVVVAEEFAATKLRDKIDKELARIDHRANPPLPTEDNVKKEETNARMEKLRSDVLDELGDMALRYTPEQVPHLHVVDLSDWEEPTLRVFLQVMQAARLTNHPNEELQRPEPETDSDDDDDSAGDLGEE